jgi:carboxymethylenebutenolidase
MACLFAEEGYLVVAAELDPAARGLAESAAEWAAVLRARSECEGRCGLLAYGEAGAAAIQASSGFECAVLFAGTEQNLEGLRGLAFPALAHVPGAEPEALQARCDTLSGGDLRAVPYPDCGDDFFVPDAPGYRRPAAMMAHSRTLAVLRRHLGPEYDLEALWDAHTFHEFATRDVDATMKTMVREPYVNHIPTLTGGVGGEQLRHFYKHHFVHSNPEDTQLIPISRTVGTDRLVDEMLFCFTHTCEIPWMIPGIAPTGKYVEVPLIAIVNFRGDKLYHEHIYWDQASVLTQLGLLDPKTLPVAGASSAAKRLDETLPSNELMGTAWQGPSD